MGAVPKNEDIQRATPVEDTLRHVIDTIPCLVTRSRPDGYVDFINRRWLEFTGFKLEEVLGWGWRAAFHPDDVEKYIGQWRAALAAGQPLESEARIRRSDGEYRWFLIRTVALRDEHGSVVKWYGACHDIEDLKEATERLGRNEAELRQILDAIPAHVFVLEPDANFLAGRILPNRQDLEYTGRTLQEAREHRVLVLHPDDRENLRRLRQRALEEGIPFEAEARVRRKDGQYRWFLIRVCPLRDENGRIVRWYGTRTDIDDRKRAEDHLRLVIDTIPQQIWSGTQDGSPDFFNAQWHSYTGLTREETQDEGWLRTLHPDDRDRALNVWRESVMKGTPYEVEVRRRRADGQYRWFLSRALPLKDSDGHIVRWYGTITDIEDRKEAENHLRLVIDTIPQAIWSGPPDGSLDFFNAQWLSYTGLTQEEAQGKGWQRILHPDDRDRVLKAWRDSVMNGTPFEQEERRRASNGQYRWFLARGVPLKDSDGHIVRWYGTNTDIEERKRAEEEIRRSEDHLRLVIDTIPQQIMSGPGDGSLDFANAQWRSYTGLMQEELQGTGWQRIIHPDDREGLLKAVEQSKAQGKPYEQEVRRRGVDGRYRWFLARGVPLKDSEGRIVRWYGSNTDIEDRKEAETRLRLVVDTTPAMLYSARPDGYLDFFNKRWLDYLGRSLDDVSGWGWTSAIHPDDLEDLVGKWRTAMETGQTYKTEARVRRADGEYRWMLLQKVPLHDQSGKIVKWYGSGVDIEDRKRSEQALRRAAEFDEAALKSLGEGLFTIDTNGLVTSMNPAAEELFGWSFGEMRGKKMHDMTHHHYRDGRPLPSSECVGFQVLTHGQSLKNHEDVFIRKDGTFFDVIYSIAPIRDAAGQVTGQVVVFSDITERKRAEERLLESEARFRLVADSAPVMIWMSGTDKLCTYFNKQWLDFTGRSVEQELGNGWAEGVHPEDLRSCMTTYIQAFDSREEFRMEYRLRRHDGEFRWVLDIGVPRFNPDGSFAGYIGSSVDVTEQRRAEEQLRQTQDELYKENLALKEEIGQASMFEEIIGSSAELRRVLVLVQKVAPTDSTVLITGETGTGKELVARAIHKRSNRTTRAFVSVNCAAIPPSLVAAELFGYEKGAFTGATERRLGRFELADGGTIFLDEIGDLPPETQIALLRVLQERTFERIGGGQPISVNVRVLAATNHDLRDAVEKGTFREDLFYRLNVFPIYVPPLRERPADIPLLVEYFVQRYAKKAGKTIRNIKRKTLDLLQAYDWPGNVRELQNVIERAVILCEGDTLTLDETWLPRESPKPTVVRGLGRLEESQERKIIESALTETRGQVSGPTGAAAKLGIPRSTLESRIRSLGIDKKRFNSR
jgi:PAS domain S-box-containing protein